MKTQSKFTIGLVIAGRYRQLCGGLDLDSALRIKIGLSEHVPIKIKFQKFEQSRMSLNIRSA